MNLLDLPIEIIALIINETIHIYNINNNEYITSSKMFYICKKLYRKNIRNEITYIN